MTAICNTIINIAELFMKVIYGFGSWAQMMEEKYRPASFDSPAMPDEPEATPVPTVVREVSFWLAFRYPFPHTNTASLDRARR
eukprot:COSAG05_NODE_1121_length_5808_cov_2.774391_10_plen_83_part_00